MLHGIKICLFIGFEHMVLFKTCGCEDLVVTLVKARLWPATPFNPRLVFTFDLLDWAEALLLESQTALKDFCMSLSYRCPFLFLKLVFIFYINLIIFFRVETFMSHCLTHLRSTGQYCDTMLILTVFIDT